MVRHIEPTRSYWTLPGGGVEVGETFAQAAVREMFEETGLRVRAVRQLWEGVYGHGGRTSPEYCFLVEKLYRNRFHGAEPPCFRRAIPRLRGHRKLLISSPAQAGACPLKALPFRAGHAFYTVSELHGQGQDAPALGLDPEEAHLPAASRLLQGVAWVPLAELAGDAQVARVLRALAEQA